MKRQLLAILLFGCLLVGCVSTAPADPGPELAAAASTAAHTPPPSLPAAATIAPGTPAPTRPTSTPVETVTATAAASAAGVPRFDHVLLIVFENRSFDEVIGSIHAGDRHAPTFNRLAQEYTLLTQYYAVSHPSLPNYLALVGGDTFGIHSDCTQCFIDQPSLATRFDDACIDLEDLSGGHAQAVRPG